MKYKYTLSASVRLVDQYTGFVKTKSPQFWSDTHIELFPFPASTTTITDLSVPNNTVLGKRAEVFFAAMILNSTSYRLVASQIQLITDGITLGEMDFVVEDIVSNKLIHVELAYKFYLLDTRISNSLAKWVGPNLRDSLERKWLKLQEVQFPKLYSPSAINILRKLGCENQPSHQSLCMPMQLFLPFGESKSGMEALPVGYAGRWISFNDFTNEKWNDYTFFIPEKEDWFVDPEKCEIWLSQAEVMPVLIEKNESSKSPMVWIKLKADIPTRLFVTFW
ncbi:DUF1853 family protein [Cryomorpha ignava]|uniref:DUF1853 family protein n=1 Tax=Cryomorpha ignava TaxID=101383 RepID=A0A7K3WLZ1_9FLAO|nr:DUF1853 family protein [Cryomorpha ignava]NEN22484.1 DUF1853 family protein [Cryomorpha ignava]